MYYYTTYQSPLGEMTLACKEEGLVGLWNEGQKYHGATILLKASKKEDMAIFEKTKKWLNQYFEGENPDVNQLALAPQGSEFRQKVWEILLQIPYGQVMSYGEIAKKIGEERASETMSAQAVGGAVGHNPISIIIPCHRVVGTGGSLTGYAGGIETKIKLLQLEGVNMEGLFVPKKGTAL